MKRCVSITFDIDIAEEWPDEAEDTPAGAIDYAKACIRGEADWPGQVTITCQRETERVNT